MTNPGLPILLCKERKAYDGTTLVRLQQTFQGKDVYGHQLTAHVDQKGVITSISGNSAQQLGQQNTLKRKCIYLQKMQKRIFTKSTEKIFHFFRSQLSNL
jgi:Zn-dependent metalloprotease